MGMWLSVGALSIVLIISLLRIGRVSKISPDGVTVQTLLHRHRFIPWSNLKSPVRLSKLLWMTLIEVQFAESRFLSLRLSITAWVPGSIGKEVLLSAIPESLSVSDWSWNR